MRGTKGTKETKESTVETKKGRKPNEKRNAQIQAAFLKAKSRKDFATKVSKLGLSESTASVYWYSLCKASNRKVVEQRGRKPSPTVDLSKRISNLMKFVESEIHKALASDHAVSELKSLLEAKNGLTAAK